jgi:hypothetical protein
LKDTIALAAKVSTKSNLEPGDEGTTIEVTFGHYYILELLAITAMGDRLLKLIIEFKLKVHDSGANENGVEDSEMQIEHGALIVTQEEFRDATVMTNGSAHGSHKKSPKITKSTDIFQKNGKNSKRIDYLMFRYVINSELC